MSLPKITLSAHETALLITLVARFVLPSSTLTDEENAVVLSSRYIYREALKEIAERS